MGILVNIFKLEGKITRFYLLLNILSRVTVQIPLGAWLGLGIQPWYGAPVDLRVKLE